MIAKTYLLRFFVLIGLFLLINSCVDEYWPDLKDSDEQIIVIDGKITNNPGPYTVKISYSSTLQNPQFNGISEATVVIQDNEGNSETLTEISSGVYQTDENGIQGVIGRSYKIIINTLGKQYESDFQELLPTSSYESISVEEETRISQYDEEEFEEGYQFYVTPILNQTTENYFYWEVIETYEYHSPYHIHRIYNGHITGTEYGADENFHMPEIDTLFRCWLTKPVNEKFVFNASQLNESTSNKIPLSFVRYDGERLKFKYSILVNQYNISEDTYGYLKNLSNQQLNQGGLYTNQPYQLQGNVKNINNINEIALGYFLVGSVNKNQSQRLTVITPKDKNIWQNHKCEDQSAPLGNLWYFDWYYRNSPELYPMYLSAHETAPTLYYYFPEPCVNCTLSGGKDKRPDYWDDDNVIQLN